MSSNNNVVLFPKRREDFLHDLAIRLARDPALPEIDDTVAAEVMAGLRKKWARDGTLDFITKYQAAKRLEAAEKQR